MSADDRTRALSVTVAVLTRRRPRMLAELLQSYTALDTPPNCDARFLVVENDTESQSRDTVAAFEDKVPAGSLHYVLETELGIPFGRNRAAREAIGWNSDLLAFVDDDEVVAKDWLANLIGGYRRSGAILMGAPLRLAAAEAGLTWGQRKMHACLDARYTRKERRAARRGSLDATPGVTIVTNNWLGETAIFAEHGIWFDEAMRHTGGTDAKLYDDVRRRGLPTGWVSDAFVHETVPPERLTFRYQFRRASEQSNTNFARKIARKPSARLSVLATVPTKALMALGLALALPFTRAGTLLDLARTSGWIAGRLRALAGRRSQLYSKTTGY